MLKILYISQLQKATDTWQYTTNLVAVQWGSLFFSMIRNFHLLECLIRNGPISYLHDKH